MDGGTHLGFRIEARVEAPEAPGGAFVWEVLIYSAEHTSQRSAWGEAPTCAMAKERAIAIIEKRRA